MERETNLEGKQEKLKTWLQKKMPQAKELHLSPLVRAGGGFSNETYLFDLTWNEDGKAIKEEMVIRWPPSAYHVWPESDAEASMNKQYRVMKCLSKTALPIAKMWWYEEDTAIVGHPFFVMGRIKGESPPDFPPGPHGVGLFFDAALPKRQELWWRSVEAMYQVHSVDWKKVGLSFLGAPKKPSDALDQQIEFWERILKWAAKGQSFPVLNTTFDWVKKNRYEPAHISLCWGDARPGNIMFKDDKIQAVVDWELAYIGDPESDLAYFLFVDQCFAINFGVPRLAGLPDEEETLRYYEKLSGRKMEHYFYHKIFAMLRLGVMSVQSAPSIALAGGPKDAATNNVSTRELIKALKIKVS